MTLTVTCAGITFYTYWAGLIASAITSATRETFQ